MFTVTDPENKTIPVVFQSDRRLKKSLRWGRQADGSILVRVPYRYPKREYPQVLKDVERQLARAAKRKARLAKGRTDADLQARAEQINNQYFNGELQWTVIRWVSNMTTRLGSCTSGGATDGHIRISDKIKDWPDWVVDYVIAHELAHIKHPDHSKAFWRYVQKSYPKTEQARGFIKGLSWARDESLALDEN
jgi:hypothetical protein